MESNELFGRSPSVIRRKRGSVELIAAQAARERQSKTPRFDMLVADWERKKIIDDEKIMLFCRDIEQMFESRRPDPEKFRGFPSVAGSIDRDIASVNRKQSGINNLSVEERRNYDNELVERHAETVIMYALEQGIIAPDDMEIVPGSKYDDFFSGVDVVIPFYDKKSGVFVRQFSIDVKAGTSGIMGAVEQIAKKISLNLPMGAKYHQQKMNTEDNDFTKKTEVEMPNAIVAFEKATLKAFLYVLSRRKDVRTDDERKRFEQLQREAFAKIRGIFFVGLRLYCSKILKTVSELGRKDSKLSQVRIEEYSRIIDWANQFIDEKDDLIENV